MLLGLKINVFQKNWTLEDNLLIVFWLENIFFLAFKKIISIIIDMNTNTKKAMIIAQLASVGWMDIQFINSSFLQILIIVTNTVKI